MREIENQQQLEELFEKESLFEKIAFQNVDFEAMFDKLPGKRFKKCVFLGCNIPAYLLHKVIMDENLVFPEMDVPFNPYRASLYTHESIYENFDPEKPDSYQETPDNKIYNHYMKTGKADADNIYETLARRLHDHAITDALKDKLKEIESKSIVAIMGGHSLERGSDDYKKIALIAKELYSKGFFILSGGGPGAMEATHLGCYMSAYCVDDIKDAIQILSAAPTYKHPEWLSTAYKVLEKYPQKNTEIRDIGIPTWLYGHEPPTPFASLIAKYFANSVREEGLLALAKGGIVYAPGSAGTIQEIFQDAAQNHYISFDIASPMIFLDTNYWNIKKPIFPLLQKLSEGYEYQKLLHISDEISDIVSKIADFRKSKN